MVMMMMMTSTFISHDSINLNAQCAEGGGGGGGDGGYKEKLIIIKKKKEEKKRHMVQSHSQNRWVFRCL